MGCGASSERPSAWDAPPAPTAHAAALLTIAAVTAPEFEASAHATTTATAAEELLAEGSTLVGERKDSSLPAFPSLTAMLVMPFRRFRAQGRIIKSVKSWRDEALAKGWLVEFKEGSGKVAIFISHTYARALPPPRPANQTLCRNSPSYCYILRR